MFGREKEIVMDQCRFPWWQQQQQQQREMDGLIDRYKIMDGGRMNSCLMIFNDVVAG
jgi:hypothetical protein